MCYIANNYNGYCCQLYVTEDVMLSLAVTTKTIHETWNFVTTTNLYLHMDALQTGEGLLHNIYILMCSVFMTDLHDKAVFW